MTLPAPAPVPAGLSDLSAARAWSIRITALLMLAYWVARGVLSRAWLAASVDECGPESEPECGMFDGMYELASALTVIMCIAGGATLLGVWANRFGGHLTALILHLVSFCTLGISAEYQGHIPGVTTWNIALAAANVAIIALLVNHLLAYHKPIPTVEHPQPGGHV